MQPILTRMLILLITALPVLGAGYELQLAYSDLQSGPLLTAVDNGAPLPDGCVGQIIEHVTDGPVLPPDARGNPSGKDRLLIAQKFAGHANTEGVFQINGGMRLNAPGFFALNPGLAGNTPPAHPIYLRIWNAATPAQATLYYETPLYTVSEGVQQLNFAREQLICHAWESPSEKLSANDPFIPHPSSLILSSFPNPFNPETLLTFALPQAAQVRLDVYDVQGRIARTLINGALPAGEQRVAFRAVELTSGAYFAVLRVNGMARATQRLMLLK